MRRVTLRFAAVAVLAAAGCSGAAATEPVDLPGVRPGAAVIRPEARQPAPAEALPLVTEPQRRLGVPDLAGKVAVLNFWASWCGPCVEEQPDLNAAHARLAGDDVAFLGVNIQDTRPNASAHLRSFAVPYPSLFDDSLRYAAGYEGVGPRAIPSTILLDRRGRVAIRLFGITTPDELEALVGLLVAEEPA